MNNVNEVLGKYITRTTNERFLVQVYKDRKLEHVGTFPTQEEAVIGRDAYLRGETVINPANPNPEETKSTT
jgi:hypothetical protein